VAWVSSWVPRSLLEPEQVGISRERVIHTHCITIYETFAKTLNSRTEISCRCGNRRFAVECNCGYDIEAQGHESRQELYHIVQRRVQRKSSEREKTDHTPLADTLRTACFYGTLISSTAVARLTLSTANGCPIDQVNLEQKSKSSIVNTSCQDSPVLLS
jgi:hypothetical protein